MVFGLPTYFWFFRIDAVRSAAETMRGSLNGIVWLTLVVHLGTLVPQDDVLDPVGGRPAGRVTGLDARAPRLDAGGRDVVGELDHLVPRGGDLVVLLLEQLRRVPHQRLDVGAHRHAVDLAVDGGVLGPVLRPVLVEVRLHRGGQLLELAGLRERGEQTRLREDRDVRRLTSVGTHLHLGLKLAGPLVLDLDVGAGLELLPGLREPVSLNVANRRVDGDGLLLVDLVCGVRRALRFVGVG
jgi:hypothetical protein